MEESLVAKIVALNGDTSFDSSWVSDVIERLKSLGYVPVEEDLYLISFCIQKVESYIKNICNINKIDECLRTVAIDRVCGEVLICLKNTDRLKESYGIEEVVKSIQTGDIDVVFEKEASNEQRLDRLIAYLLGSGEGELIGCRRIKW